MPYVFRNPKVCFFMHLECSQLHVGRDSPLSIFRNSVENSNGKTDPLFRLIWQIGVGGALKRRGEGGSLGRGNFILQF